MPGIIQPINSHGVIVARAPSATPTVFTDIASLKTDALPEISRNEFDATTQNINIDTYAFGVIRRKGIQITVNFVPT